MNVQFHYQSKIKLPAVTRLKAFLNKIAEEEHTLFESIDVIFCSDKKLLKINQDFLKHDFYTDIITFNLAEKGQPTAGELYISVDRVKEDAKNLGVAFNAELRRVIFHGILHLCGYKDKSALQIKAIRQKEDFYISLYESGR